MKTVQLTIIIPAYNAERYLCKCLDSMVGIDVRLEIVVVDDGSTDATGQIADQYAEKFPQVRVIHKENGGHGSAINAGAAIAKGRYIKVIDADDWIVTENLCLVLDRLAESCADAAVAGFHKVAMGSGRKIAYSSECEYAGSTVDVNELLYVYEVIPNCFLFHGLFYRTEWYRKSGIQIIEGVYYDDQEYATLPFAYLNTLLVLPEFFYEYMVGNSSQSVSYQNMAKRAGQIEEVLRHMTAFYDDHAFVQEAQREYILRKICALVTIYFSVTLIKNPDRRRGKTAAVCFYRWLQADAPYILKRVQRKYHLLCLIRLLHFPPGLYDKLAMTSIYQVIRKILLQS